MQFHGDGSLVITILFVALIDQTFEGMSNIPKFSFIYRKKETWKYLCIYY